MCGIAGYLLNNNSVVTSSNEVLKTIESRGPDNLDYFVEDCLDDIKSWSFFHSRLSIMDVDTRSNQPFIDPTGRYVLVFNGEIYNFHNLKKTLSYNFITESDTEVLLALLIEEGIECLNKLEGMFAFSFFDKSTRKVIMARDQFGKKPLYYFCDKTCFVFSSKIETILKIKPEIRNVEKQNISDFLFFQTNLGDKVILNSISQVLPGNYLIVDSNGEIIEYSKYSSWQDFKINKNLSKVDIIKNVKYLVEDAVKKRLICDVPYAIPLSGGIDSTVITGLAANLSESKVNTFTLSFDNLLYDESVHAEIVSEKFQTNHFVSKVNSNDILLSLDDYIAAMDYPTVDGFNTFLVSKKIREAGFKMALSGIGGDEWFLGYDYFRRYEIFKSFSSLGNLRFLFENNLFPLKLRKFFNSLYYINKFGSNANSTQRILYDSVSLEKVLNLPKVKFNPISHNFTSSQSSNSINEWYYYCQPVLLRDTDQFSMAAGIEMRAPFMDKYLVEYLLSIPDGIKLGKTPKELLITAFSDYIPVSLINKKKKGFVLPYESWLKNELSLMANDCIINFSLRINSPNLLKEWDLFKLGRSNFYWTHFWAIVILEKWINKNELNFVI